MAEPVIRFSCREPEIDTQRPLIEGTVKVEGFQLKVVPGMAPDPEWDARDFISTGRLWGYLAGDDLTCIPAYPNRKFRLQYIYVNVNAGIESPKDLEGKRVSILYWGNPAAVWAKGALQNYYGVDLTKIKWHAIDLTTVVAPRDVDIRKIPRGSANDMLLEGKLDAVIDANVIPAITHRDPRVRRLFQDWKSEEMKYFKETGVFPISHVVSLKKSFVKEHPNAPRALLDAFRAARDVAFNRIEGGDPEVITISWASHMLAEQRAVMGDHYWAYNIKDNRRTLEALTQFSYQQGVVLERIDYMDLFDNETASDDGY